LEGGRKGGKRANLGFEIGVSALVLFDFGLVFPLVSLGAAEFLHVDFHLFVLAFQLVAHHLILIYEPITTSIQ